MVKAFIFRFRNLSIKKMFLICLFTFIICPLILIAFFMNQEMSQIISKQVHENRMSTLIQTQKNISSVLNEIDRISISLLSNDSLQEYCIDCIEAEKVADQADLASFSLRQQRLKDDIMRFTNDLAVSKTYLHSISVSRDNENIIQYGGFVDPEDTRYYDEAMNQKGKGYWTPVYNIDYGYDSKYNVPVVSYIRCVNNLNTFKVLAIEKITIKEEALNAIFTSRKNQEYEDDLSFIIGVKGDVVSSEDKTLLGKLYPDFNLMKEQMKSEEGYFKYIKAGSEMSVFYSAIENTHWKLVQVVPQKIMNMSMGMVNNVILISIFLCILFSILFTFIQNHYVIKPIINLSSEMKKVETGDFEVSLPSVSENETGMLSIQFLNMTKQLKYLFETVYCAEIKEREAELMALQMQINPHFLYNTLDSIYWLAYKNKDYVVGEQIEVLSSMFRHTLNSGNEYTTIEKELQHLRDYMYIQKIRMGERVQLVIEADPKLVNCQSLKLILQPLVENAVIHGLEDKVEGGVIKVMVEHTNNDIVYIIEDNGLGTDESVIREKLENSEEHNPHGLALKNIHERIRIRYGQGYGLYFNSIVNGGTRVEVRFPYIVS